MIGTTEIDVLLKRTLAEVDELRRCINEFDFER